MYLSPRPTAEFIKSFYPVEYDPYQSPVEDEHFVIMRWMRRRKLIRRLRLVERYSGLKRGFLLDVGCATGLFIHEMDRAGWNVAGVEPIASAAAYARNHFGLNVFQGTLEDVPSAPESFDVITFWDVLEHTFSPKRALLQASRLLREGGVIAVNVPNWDSVERRLFGRYWQGLDSPRHLFVFTRTTLTALLEKAGFSVLDWTCFMPGYFSFVLSLDRWLKVKGSWLSGPVRWLLSVPGMRLPFEPGFTFLNWLRQGTLISVFARKTPAGGKGQSD